ncbi:hypothetical protein F3Y22_tig00111848pilonHSYRG00131 [Hibiscus syriacus]|uniref:FLZ-type domain-containing protein n=1 Tax=Hibiscus syriacus TaxID=106335 RepID=A0A6A2XQN6_HIBSY|nr:FCS-Like Zinc finger 2-like [Hibiscus syriacus]KAE8672200.1 hypothetical protein F3Y22_tig00111848pilonHSYRG00131 [Hibiscus syriacus]
MEYSGSSSRRPCFIKEDDDGFAFLADMEAGYSGTHYQNGFFSRRTRLRNLTYSSCCSRFARFSDGRFKDHQQPHFLDACFLCKKPLGANRDIFMYRGDTPFCSEECRKEKIEMDEALEKNRNLSSSMKASRSKEQRKAKSLKKAQDYPFITGTVAAV